MDDFDRSGIHCIEPDAAKAIHTVFFTVLSTIGAFAIWEAASIWIVENPRLRIQSRTIGRWAQGLELEFRVRDKSD